MDRRDAIKGIAAGVTGMVLPTSLLAAGKEPIKKGLSINFDVETRNIQIFGDGKLILDGNGPYERWIGGLIINQIGDGVEEDRTENPIQIREAFFQHQEILQLINEAGTSCTWDWATSLGETIKEKYESMYVKMVEVTNVIIRKCFTPPLHTLYESFNNSGFWIVASPEICSIFETAKSGFAPSETYKTHSLAVNHLGQINWRWQLYCDAMLDKDMILIGRGKDKMPQFCYGSVKVLNFII